MKHLVLALLAPFAAMGQKFTLEVPPEEAAQPFSLNVGTVTPTVASVEAARREMEARTDLTKQERDEERARLQRDYDIAIRLLEAQRAAEKHREDAMRQGAEFSKEFLVLNPASDDFATKFDELMEKYPLAAEEPLSAKLIERARRQLSREAGAATEPSTSKAAD